jgi:glycosyltransferase involved in cell wall biosynthesis
MRILVLTHEYPPIGGGGGRVAQDMCQQLVLRGHEVQLLTACWGNLERQEKQAGVNLFRLDSGRKMLYQASFGDLLGYVWTSLWAGLGMIRRWKPDLIHVHFAVPAGATAWALHRLTGVPYVVTTHLGDVPGGVPSKTKRWFRWVFPFTPSIWREAAAVVAVSEFTRKLAQASYPGVEIRVITNGLDLKELDPGEITPGDPPELLFIGRFVTQKNPLQLVHTLSTLKDLPWKCCMLGDGELYKEVTQLADRYGILERIHLPGWVSQPEVMKWYQQSDILCMPSLEEGLSVAGIQALAMGLALVVNRAGGNAEIISPGENGFLLDVGDEEGFTAALRNLLENPQQLLAFRQASRRLAMRFDLQKIMDAYEQVFSQAVGGKA